MPDVPLSRQAQIPSPRWRTFRNGATAWLVRFARNRWWSLALVAAIVATDQVLLQRSVGFTARALLDEPCHLATGVILLGTLTRWRGRAPARPFAWALLAASVAIDLDHLPGRFAASGTFYGSLPRPYTHALWLLLLLIVVALPAAGWARSGGRGRATLVAGIFAGASWGLASHFLRDLATAPIALLWPVSPAPLQVPYGWYLALLLVLVILPVRRRWLAWPVQRGLRSG